MKSTAPPQALSNVQRAKRIQRVTLVAICTNALLAAGQFVIGLFSNAFSLVADAVHTLSDLITDVMVLFAGRKSEAPADRDHPYGHGRFETAATLLLGVALIAIGMMFLWNAGLKLQDMESAPPIHSAALWMAGITLLAKEGLFRFTLAASRRLKAPMLEANAWHARSDAASSLVVAIGIAASLAGYPFLEPLAAAVVGFLIVNMGARIGWRALSELVDTGLPAPELDRLKATIEGVSGVISAHDIRTRRMANRVLCDAHVQVDPRITVSEGHHLSDQVYFRIRESHPDIHDVLVHVDAEDDGDLQTPPPGVPPERDEVERLIAETITPSHPVRRIQIHYLGQRVEVEVFLDPMTTSTASRESLNQRIRALCASDPRFRKITLLERLAP